MERKVNNVILGEARTCAGCGKALSVGLEVVQVNDDFGQYSGIVSKYFCNKEPECQCRCYPEHSEYPTYCPHHDGDYGEWKFGRNGEDFDE